jgi:hypothetical protein
MVYWLDGRDSIPGKEKRFFLLHSVQAGSEVHPASSLMGTGLLFPGGKAAGA